MHHIQDYSETSSLEKHWGFEPRIMPCTADTGTCQYLDAVYHAHDLSMLYTFILWAIILGILSVWVGLRVVRRFSKETDSVIFEVDGQQRVSPSNLHRRLVYTTTAYLRRRLLPESLTLIFGHVSRLQLLIFAILSGYLILFSLIGITYKNWVTPHKTEPGLFNTRTGAGGFADRVGSLAFALTPLTIALSTRESILTLITGVSYQHFNFLHRWTGRIMYLQSFMHIFIWTVVQAYLYQPQPSKYHAFIIQPYIIWGIVAMTLLTFLTVFSMKSVIKWTGYEFFLISHLIVAGVYIGACWSHWDKLKCWMIASLVILLLDLVLRWIHFALIHFRFIGDNKGFVAAQARLRYFDDSAGGIVRLDFEHAHKAWSPGQHYFLTFPNLSIWQAHPFTVLSSPRPESPVQKHSYIIRCRLGETAKLGNLASQLSNTGQTTPVLLTGPYGTDVIPRKVSNILAITGGTGISFTLPVLLEATMRPNCGLIQLIWIVRYVKNLEWVASEIEALKDIRNFHLRIIITNGKEKDAKDLNVELKDEKNVSEMTVNEEKHGLGSLPEEFDLVYLNRRPNLKEEIQEYMEKTDGKSLFVVGSGPPGLGADARKAVASFNSARKVWTGDKAGDMGFYWDY
ncbi:ferric-chelate reductase [Blumeria hordei DH14]|uniref:ferric-chelate reductase (NADPH) n=1 Tax=Blumeria graminis f. sp. hordei (strain DH14) TaxID=546991 RepID=N1JCI9_BLUG1|nr:ferric-chelate reductase [Blumeria hordei DH14]